MSASVRDRTARSALATRSGFILADSAFVGAGQKIIPPRLFILENRRVARRENNWSRLEDNDRVADGEIIYSTAGAAPQPYRNWAIYGDLTALFQTVVHYIVRLHARNISCSCSCMKRDLAQLITCAKKNISEAGVAFTGVMSTSVSVYLSTLKL